MRYAYTFFPVEDETCGFDASSVTEFLQADSPADNQTGLAVWQLIEANSTVLCACLIASRPFAMYLMPDKLVARVRSVASKLRRSGKTDGTQSTQESAHERRNQAPALHDEGWSLERLNRSEPPSLPSPPQTRAGRLNESTQSLDYMNELHA